MKHCH